MVNGGKMKKIKSFVSLFIIFCIMLCGCGNSDLLDFNEPAFKERYEEITDALCIACTSQFDSNDLEFILNPTTFDNTEVDLSTIKINKLGNVYKPNYSDFNARFCGIEIEFKKKNSDDVETTSFLLIVEGGMYGLHKPVKTPKGVTDTTVSIDGVDKFVESLSLMLKSGGEKSKINVDYYGSTIDIDYLNKMFSEKIEKDITSDNIENFNNNTIEDNYREILNACNQEDTENNFTYREYYITDINNDGIPELIIHIGRNIKDAEYIIYTYKDNNSYECGVSGGILNIEDENEEKLERLSRESQEIITKGDNCIYISFCYAGYQHTSEIKLKDNLLLDISDYYDSGSEKLSDYNIPGDVIVNADFSDTDLLVSALDMNTQMIEKPRTVITTKSVTTKESTTTTTTVTTTQTSKVESDIKTYNITFEASELIEKAGLKLGGHVGIAVLSNLTCSNGNANIETNTIYNYDSLVKVEVTGATAGEVVLGGTITTYGLDMVQGEPVSYPDSSGVFLISKTVGEISEDKPYAEAYIEASRLTQGDGYEYNLYVSGDFSYVEVSYYANGGEEEINYTSGSSSPIFLTAGSSFGSVTAYVTPYNSDGIAGETVSCTGYASGTVQTDCFSYSVDNAKGQINCHGGIVAGFTTDYVVNGGAVGKVRNSLGDKWHVTAKNVCTNYGITWYELWDSDDGDYYGWVDSNYIDFY